MKTSLAYVFLMSAALPVAAHHSYAAFDMKTSGTLTGTIVEWAWTNPHCFLYVEVVGTDGRPERWAFETSSPALLSRVGFARTTFQPGEKVGILYHPSRERPTMGALDTITSESGVKWSTATGKLPTATP